MAASACFSAKGNRQVCLTGNCKGVRIRGDKPPEEDAINHARK